MTLSTTGNRIGIGNMTTPASTFHVEADADGAKQEFTHASSGSTWFTQFSSGNGVNMQMRDATNTRTVFIRSYGDSFLTAGKLGIGTSSPDANLHVKNGSAGDALLKLETTSAGDPTIEFASQANRDGIIKFTEGGTVSGQLSYSHSDDVFKFIAASSTDVRAQIGETTSYFTSNVGIGTTSPTYSLDLVPNSASALRVKNSTNGLDVNCAIENAGILSDDGALLSMTTQAGAGDPSMRFAIAGNETWSMGIDNSDNDKFKISQSSTLHTDTRITLQGNKVGIGTSSPTQALDVSGSVNVTGSAFLGYPLVLV